MPETLEQLKIGLENITHVHVNTNKPNTSTGLSSQASTTAFSAMVSPHAISQPLPTETGHSQQQPQVIFYQSQEYIISDSTTVGLDETIDPSTSTGALPKAQEYILEGTTYAAVVAGDYLTQSAQQHHSTTNDTSSMVESLELSQEYPSRRTSAEFGNTSFGEGSLEINFNKEMPGEPNTAIDSSILYIREKQLTNQGSVDRIDRFKPYRNLHHLNHSHNQIIAFIHAHSLRQLMKNLAKASHRNITIKRQQMFPKFLHRTSLKRS
uniref:Uncharacterized protein n=1 Tax=Anopheles epiroticus TaxID=199890 RepID=A0A182P5U2_9DIPT